MAIACSIRDMLSSHLKPFTYTPAEVEELEKTQNLEFHKTLNQHDLCVIGGGGLYSKFFLPFNAQVIKSIETPIVLYGIGYIRNLGDKDLTNEQIESARFLNIRAKLTSVRDEYTCKFLRDLGIQDVHIIGDPAIFLGFEETNQVALDKNKVKIGVNVASHYWELYPKYLNRTIGEYIKACEFLIKRLDAEIVYLIHHSDEHQVVEAMKKKNLPLKVVDTNPNPYKMKFIYGKLDLVIGMMMHSTVLAFGSGVPIVNIAYDAKNYNFMEFIGQGDKVIDVREANFKEISDLAMRALDDSKNIKAGFKALKGKLWRRQEDFLTKIKELCM
ncbi:MAG: polysaccharide pyruvyl transferase family protein [Candidatus Hadarchaeaceae archaeon]